MSRFVIFGSVSGKFVEDSKGYRETEAKCLEIEAKGKHVEDLYFDDAKNYNSMYPDGSLEAEGQTLNFKPRHRAEEMLGFSPKPSPIFEFMECF